MSKQAVAKKAETKHTASPDAHEAPAIKTEGLQWHSEGFCWREALVTLPEGMIFQDLLDVPTVWKKVQQCRPTELRRFDRVTCVAADGSWCVKDAMVIDADVTSVRLAIKPSDRITMPSPPEEVI